MHINEQTFRQWWEIFHTEAPLCEVRMLGKKTVSGYFTDCETALNAIKGWYGEEFGVYACINEINKSCYLTKQRDCLLESPKKTTSDSDINGRRWILIDIDPVRPSDTNSTARQKGLAKDMMKQIGIFLRDQGFASPVVADSANGYHLYYKVMLQNSEENTQLVKNLLAVLDMQFSTAECTVDTSVFNAGRISKIMGTKSNKGADVEEAPRRESGFLKVPDDIQRTDISVIQKVAAMLPEKEKPSKWNNYRIDTFDIDEFIAKYGIKVKDITPFKDGKRYVLEECPFNPDHKAPDSAIFVMNGGAIGFRCLHNSCSHYTWRDVRLHFDKDAYSKKDYDEYVHKREFYDTREKPAPTIIAEDSAHGKKWQSLEDVEWQDPSKLVYIPTGFGQLDLKIGGLALGEITIMSGLSGAGKSSIINNFILSAVHHGYKVSVWSGELMASRFKSWINQLAAGRNNVRRASGDVEYYYCPQDISQKIDQWTRGKIFLYNNSYGSKISQILSDIKECVRENGTQLIVIDNLMALQLDSYSGDKNEKQQMLINELKDFAMQSKIHIILVCHPRKEQLNQLLRMESIAGSSDLYNAASNVLLAHRVGTDFGKRATEFFGKETVDSYIQTGYNEVVEVAKNRTHGVKDHVFGLYYEPQTRRFLNSKSDYFVYGWQDQPEIQTIPTLPPDPLGLGEVGEAPF